jgi:preprotein translocase subunit SecG
MSFWRSWRQPDRDEQVFLMLRVILTIIQVFSSVAIIALVLIQRGKGADAGAGFGAGASGTVFGARGARTALSRATAVFAAVFMINSLALAYMGAKTTAAPKTILDEASETRTPAPATGAAPPASAPKTGSGAGTSAPVPAPAAPPASAPAPAPAPEQPPK